MKKITVLAFALLLSGVTLTACGQNNTSVTPPAYSGDELKAAPVFIPELPKELTFAGEKVPLHYADVQEALEREVSVTMYMHSRTIRTLRMTSRYFPVIEPILEKHGIPNDFKYLCMAESNLDPEAISSAKAAGLWQIMTSAAKDLGVETGANVDLRYNIEIATEAACKYLKSAYKRFGNWTLAAASYNCGVAGANRRMETQGVKDYYDLYLPQETMRYVYRILSFKLLVEDPQKYGFYLKTEDYFQPYKNYKEVTVESENIDWSKFAAEHGTNYKMLRALNPWIRSYEYANKAKKAYKVLVPTEGFREKGW